MQLQVEDLIANDDYDGDRSLLTVTAVRGDTGEGVTGLQDRYIEYQLPTNYFGTTELIYTVSDGTLEDEGVVRVVVEDVNDAPVASPDGYKVQAGTTLVVEGDRGLLVNDSDLDNNTLTAVLDTAPTQGSLNLSADGSFTYTPNAGVSGVEDSFTYFANDGTVNSDQPVTVSIDIPADTTIVAPEATDDSYVGTEDQILTIKSDDVLSNDSDPDGGPAPIQIAGVYGAKGGMVSLEDANIFFTPDVNFNGIASFIYVLSDETLTDIGRVTIDFQAVNDAPVANDEPEPFIDRYAAYTGDTLNVVASEGVLFNDVDVDGDTLTATVASAPTNGTLNFNSDGSFTYTADVGFVGEDEFSYIATDGQADTAETRVLLSVSDQGSDGGNGTSLSSSGDGGGSGGGSGGGDTTSTTTDGDDNYAGTSGADDANGGAGNDTMAGGDGNDVLRGGDGNDVINGQFGNDALVGGAGDDELAGGSGNDNIASSAGNDTAFGGLGNDFIGGGAGNDEIDGAAGDDVLGGGLDNDTVFGSAGNDIVAGGQGNDLLAGGSGSDTMGGSFGDDEIIGGTGRDNLGGGSGRDLLSGGSGDDFIGGGVGSDTINGNDGDDFLAGGGRADELFGDAGSDRLNGGAGDDTLTGGTEADVFVFRTYTSGETDVITDFEMGVDDILMVGVAGNGLQDRFNALTITDTTVFGGDAAAIEYEGHTIIVAGATAADIGIDDFLFV